MVSAKLNFKDELIATANAIATAGKGILAADESTGSITKRFESIKLESTETNRRDYREMLFSAKEAMTNHISGVILYDETLRQKAADGTPLVDVMLVLLIIFLITIPVVTTSISFLASTLTLPAVSVWRTVISSSPTLKNWPASLAATANDH